MGFIGFPIISGLASVGEFHVTGKLRQCILRNLIMYAILILILIGMVIFLHHYKVINNQADFWAFIKCLSNLYGLSLIMGLMGYGLVEIPRKYFLQSDL